MFVLVRILNREKKCNWRFAWVRKIKWYPCLAPKLKQPQETKVKQFSLIKLVVTL